MTSIGTCTGCGSKFRIGATAAGTPPRCPKCGGNLEVSEARPEPAGAGGTTPQAPRGAAQGAPPGPPRQGRPPDRGTSRRAIAVQAGRSRRNRAATGMWISVAATGAVAILLLILVPGKDSPEGGGSPAKPAPGPVAERPSAPPATPATPVPAASGAPAAAATPKPSGAGVASGPPAAGGGEKVVADPAVAAASKPVVDRTLPEIDLSTIPDVPPLKETPPELENEIRQALAAMLDPYSGAKGSRARVRLTAIGKPAFPSILNALKSLDYEKPADVETGYAVNRMLEEMAGGKTFQFRNKTDADSAKWNRHVAKAWIEVFNRVKDDPAKWKTFTHSSTLVDERGREKPESDPLAPK